MALGTTIERSAPKVLSGIWFWARAEQRNVGKKTPDQDRTMVVKPAQSPLERVLEEVLEQIG